MKKWPYSICSLLSPVTRMTTPIFDHSHPKNLWSGFNFCDHVSTCKKSVYIFHLFILQIQSTLESHHLTGHTHFWWCSPKNLLCVKLYQHAKNQFHQFFLKIQSILEFRDQIGQTPFWPGPTKNFSINF